MHIAMIGLRGIPSRDGGVEVAVGELAPRLVQLGLDVTVYCRNHYMKERPKKYKGVRLVYLPTINKKHFEAFTHTLLGSIHALVFNKVDIVHYHALGNALFCRIPKLLGKQSVVTIHGFDYERGKWSSFAKAVLRMGERNSIHHADAIISVSSKIKNVIRKRYSRSIYFIPNGIPELAMSESHSTDPYILFMSRLVPEKGIHTLIKAFKEISFQGKLIIAGGGTHTESYVAELLQLARDDERIKFAGPIFGQEKSDLLRNALLFILPSTIEGMPIVLLEAMSLGTPCLVSDIQENLDVIKANTHEYAYHFEADSAESLSDHLRFVLRNPEHAKSMGALGQKYVKSNFNWDRIAVSTYQVYTRLMASI